MDIRVSRSTCSLGLIAALGFQPTVAHAYIGPGMGAGAVLVTIGIVVALLVVVFSLVWYPIKRWVSRLFRGGSG